MAELRRSGSGELTVADQETKAILTETEKGFLEGLNLLQEDHGLTRQQIIDKNQKKEEDKLAALRKQKKINQTQFQQSQLTIEQKFNEQRQAEAKKQQAFERMIQQQKLGATSTFLGGMAALASLGGRKAFLIAKRFAQAQAITDGIAAVQRALAGPPWPFNIAAAIGVGAMAAANVARIEASGFAHGATSVRGFGAKDSVPALLKPRERVLTTVQNQDFTEFLDRENNPRNGRLDTRQMGGGVIRIELVGDAGDLVRAQFIEQDNFQTSGVA